MKIGMNQRDNHLFILPIEPYKHVITNILIRVFSNYHIFLDANYLKSRQYQEIVNLLVGKVFTDIILNSPPSDNVHQKGYEYYIFRLLLTINKTLLDRYVFWDGENFKLADLIIDDFICELDNEAYLKSIIIPEFKEPFLEWNVKVTNSNVIVEYVGDYRIRRYHELFGNAYA